MNRPVLVYDGECGFCRRWIERWRQLTGPAVDYAASQDVAAHFPQIPAATFAEAVVLIEPDGRWLTGAAAVFAALAHGGRWRSLDWAYGRVPGFAWATELFYRQVATRRVLASRLTRWLWGNEVRVPRTELVGRTFLRGIALIYLVAFVSLWVQVDGLVGSRGVLPIAPWLDAVLDRHGWSVYWQAPTLLWLGASDVAIHLLCAAGVVAALLLLTGFVPLVAAVVAWLGYLSLYTAGRVFLSFQWDILLLECGVITILLAPWTTRLSETTRLGRVPIWLARWLVFRLMFLSGAVKLLSGDSSWTDLTALRFHYETQPLPVWTSWYVHQLPLVLQQVSTFAMFAVELGLPFLVFLPRRPRALAFWAFVAFQALIALTGNYGFFNLLTVVLCVTLLDDRQLGRLLPGRRSGATGTAVADGRSRARTPIVAVAAAGLFVLSSANLVGRIYGYGIVPRVVRDAIVTLAPYHLTSNYGLFAVMTKERPEIIIEGSNDGETWLAYEFRWKPGDPAHRPRFVAPHMPRLDWQMWFAALGHYQRNPWLIELMRRLLEGSEPVLDLLATNPFSDAPPRYVRAMIYQYRFTLIGTPEAADAWWSRSHPRLYAPVLSGEAR